MTVVRGLTFSFGTPDEQKMFIRASWVQQQTLHRLYCLPKKQKHEFSPENVQLYSLPPHSLSEQYTLPALFQQLMFDRTTTEPLFTSVISKYLINFIDVELHKDSVLYVQYGDHDSSVTTTPRKRAVPSVTSSLPYSPTVNLHKRLLY